MHGYSGLASVPKERRSGTLARYSRGRFVQQVPPQPTPVAHAYAEDGLRRDRHEFPLDQPGDQF
jgi:hypothetical protein